MDSIGVFREMSGSYPTDALQDDLSEDQLDNESDGSFDDEMDFASEASSQELWDDESI